MAFKLLALRTCVAGRLLAAEACDMLCSCTKVGSSRMPGASADSCND